MTFQAFSLTTDRSFSSAEALGEVLNNDVLPIIIEELQNIGLGTNAKVIDTPEELNPNEAEIEKSRNATNGNAYVHYYGCYTKGIYLNSPEAMLIHGENRPDTDYWEFMNLPLGDENDDTIIRRINSELQSYGFSISTESEWGYWDKSTGEVTWGGQTYFDDYATYSLDTGQYTGGSQFYETFRKALNEIGTIYVNPGKRVSHVFNFGGKNVNPFTGELYDDYDGTLKIRFVTNLKQSITDITESSSPTFNYTVTTNMDQVSQDNSTFYTDMLENTEKLVGATKNTINTYVASAFEVARMDKTINFDDFVISFFTISKPYSG